MSANATLDAERTILGAILLDNSLLHDCVELRADYFGLGAHRQIFSAMQALDSDGKPIDTVTLANQLNGEFERVGGHGALSELINNSIERPNIRPWVEIVRDAAKRRALMRTCESVVKQLDDPTQDTDTLIDCTEATLLNLRAAGSAGKTSHVKEVIVTVLNEMISQQHRADEVMGLSTGIDTIDFTTTGIRPGEYWVIGGAPSRGKTVLGAQVIATNASAGVPSLVFSAEMTQEQFVKRLFPKYSGVSASRVRDFRNATEAQATMAQQAAATIAQWPLYVCDPEGMTAAQICAIAKLHVRRHGIKLVLVDYLQIVEGQEKDIRIRVGAVSNALRSLAKTENICVVALSQLRRPTNENDRPTMFHLKESGDVEAHAHTVLLIHRPKDEQGRWSRSDEIIVAKQREGLVGVEPVSLDEKRLWFVPSAWQP